MNDYVYIPIRLAPVLRAIQTGHRTLRSLSRKLGIGHGTAYRRVREARALGLVEPACRNCTGMALSPALR